jgi:hypothetical protein
MTGGGTYSVNGGAPVPFSGASTFTVNGTGNTSLTVISHQSPVVAGPGFLLLPDPLRIVYHGVRSLHLDDAAAVNAIAGPDTADRDAAFVGLSPAERYVQALYLAELGRAGSKQELDGWVTLLPPGATSGSLAVAFGIGRSQEGRDHLVRSWYVAFLGRQANGTEERGFVSALLSGQSEEQVLSLILGSGEFFARAQGMALVPAGTPQQQFVQALYRLLLGRTGALSELAGWVGALPMLGRGGVAQAILQSGEARTDLAEGYYNALLHRPDDPVPLQNYVFSTHDAATLRLLFEATSEFFANG